MVVGRKQRRTYLKLVALRSHGSGISPPIRLSRRGPFYCPLPFLPFIFFAVFAPPYPRYLLRMLCQPLGLLLPETAQDPTPSCSVIEPSFSPCTSFGRYKTHYRAPGKERATHELLQPPPQPRRPTDRRTFAAPPRSSINAEAVLQCICRRRSEQVCLALSEELWNTFNFR